METMKNRPPLVLVVDDDVTARAIAREALEVAGFSVEEAGNGREALERARVQTPDIVLMDVVMPEMDGFAACAALRAERATRHVPVLMMTGLDDVASINRAYEAGATDFTTKPINYLLVAHRIRYILRAKITADELRASEARLANAQRIARLGHFEWELESGHVHCSPQVYRLFGIPADGSVTTNRDLLRFIHPRDRVQFAGELRSAVTTGMGYSLEHRIVRRDKTVRIMYQEGEIVRTPAGLAVSATLQDITERRNMERKVLKIANFDATTGLPNRQLMHRYLTESIAHARRNAGVVVVMAIDLDNFSRVNDTLGHGAGDALLKVVASRLGSCIRPCSAMGRVGEELQPDGDLLARTGGDEFTVVLTQLKELEDAAALARKMAESLAVPFSAGENEVSVNASIGISGFPADASDADVLLQQADTALHHAKNLGRNQWAFSSAAISRRVTDRFQLESDLRRALVAGQFELHYQPKVRTDDEMPHGTEALLRWRHPEKGLISPATFIPIAEETGLIVPISEWIVFEACRQVQEWQQAGLPPLRVAINVSSAQFRNSGLHLIVANAIAGTGIDPALVELELTESLLMEEGEASIRLMRRLRALGLWLSIDDFGTGYSSLSYLKRFPINALKIDRSFIMESANSHADGAIVAGIIALAHSLGLSVVAEGVETEKQMRLLRELKCDEVQGFYYSAPLPPRQFAAWLHDRLQPAMKAAASN
ncbi:MAG: Regulator of RpoS [Gammaproteobacteria bacterium]|nr:Regulator of RpoS [Gammaproteobacteria bacterium]